MGLKCNSFVCCLAVFVAHWAAAAARADGGLDEYSLALKLYQQARWDKAAERFELLIKNYPQHEKVPIARYYLGLAYINQQDFKAARESLRTFVKTAASNPNVAQARYRIAECSYLLDDLKAAEPELREFLDKHPDDPWAERALPYLGDVELRLGQPEASLTAFELAIKNHPEGPLLDDAKFGRAKALEALKRDADALQQYQELAAKTESPRAADAQFQLAGRLFAGKKFGDALAAYEDLLRRFPESPLASAARLNAGYALYQEGKFAEAAQRFAEAQRDPAHAVAAGYWRALSLKSLGQNAEAAKLLAEAEREAGESPLAEAIHFQRAICTRNLGDATAAREMFTHGADQWPKGEFADDCLHAAAELAVDAGDLDEASALLVRFSKDYPGSGLRLHRDLLQGRIELAKGSAAAKANQPEIQVNEFYRRAADQFEHVLKDSTLPRTQLLARYYLALAQQVQNQHQAALDALAPVLEAVQQDGAESEFGESLLIEAESRLALKQFAEAQASAEKYLSLFSQGRQIPRALYLIAIAAAAREDGVSATAALERLTKEFRNHRLTPAALLQMAEVAERKSDWPAAASRFSELIELSSGTENQAFAFRGLAWANFKQQKYDVAAENFRKVVQSFGNHKLASECAYYLAESLREGGDAEAALAAYSDAFQKFAPEQPAAPGAERNPPLIYAYLAGLQRARTLRRKDDIAQADAAYAALFDKFPQPADLDRRLDEWALLNYEAGNFERADELFRRLVQEAPDSDLADNARLSLAESDLVGGKLDDAKKAFETLFASDKSDPEDKERALYQLIVLGVEQQRWPDVRQLAERLGREFPESRHLDYAYYAEAEAILSSPKATEEQIAAEKAKLADIIKAAPEQFANDSFLGRAWVLAAEVAYREKNYDEVFRLAAELKERHPDSVFQYQAEEIVGRSYKQQAKFPEARAAFDRVLNDPAAFRTPTAAKAQFLIGETYFLEQNWDEAFIAYQKVYASYDHPDWQSAALLQSGKCDEQQQHWKEAAKTYAQLIEEFPKSDYVAEAQQRLEAAKKRAGG
jgi:TolA-binding protein